MPASSTDVSIDGQGTATLAQVLYLLNLLLLPGVAFALLLALWSRERARPRPLAIAHLAQTVAASVWAGALLLLVNGLIIVFGDYRAPSTWVIVVVYFTLCHASFVLLGAFGLSKAMAGQLWRFPLVGRPLPE